MFDFKHAPHPHSALSGVPLSVSDGDVTPPSRVPTPLRSTPKSLRPYVWALMAFKHGRHFQTKPSKLRVRRASILAEKEGSFAPSLMVSTYPSIKLLECSQLTW